MNWDIKTLHQARLISSLDRHLALNLAPQGGPVQTALALLSRALRQGHVAQDLTQLCETQLLGPEGWEEVAAPSQSELRQAVEQSPLVGQSGDFKPLIFDQGALYFQKYHRYERRLIENLTARLEQPRRELSPALEQAWKAQFKNQAPLNQGQPLAGLLAALQPLLLLTGGPGTGKTTTAFKIMAGMQQARLEAGAPPLKIRLVAPTGKAAARLGQSISAQASALSGPLAAALPQKAETIHRFLGFNPFEPAQFRHHAAYPVDLDLLILDEASMVDLPLFVKLLEAVPTEAQVVFMGDPDQLASVESGAVLADLAQDRDSRGLSQEMHQILGAYAPDGDGEAPGPPLLDHRIRLSVSHRFDAERGIGRLAEAVRLGKTPLLDYLHSEETGHQDHANLLEDQLLALLKQENQGLLQAKTPEAALEAQKGFGLLCALRQGRFGVAGVNDLAEREFGKGQLFYPYRPILIDQNAYHLGLANGDLGICLEGAGGVLEVWFEGPQGPVSFAPALLPAHSSAYALTVHKSQGSEFERVTLLLPQQFSEPLSKELVYTALTRAKARFDLLGPLEVFEQAAAAQVPRHSGLGRLLWGL